MEYFDRPALEFEATRLIGERLSQALQRGVGLKTRVIGDVLKVEGADLPSPLIVVTAEDSRRPLIRRAARRAREHSWGLPVVVVPHMTPAGIEVAEEEHVGWFDLSGNAHFTAPGIFLEVRGRPPRVHHRGRPPSVFAPRSARIARALLVHPRRRWSQKDLVRETHLSQGTISRTLSRLRELGLVENDEHNHCWPSAPDELLDAWRDEYDYRRHDILPVHLTGGGMKLTRAVVRGLREADVDYALTGLSAAWLYDGFAQFRIISVFVDSSTLQAADAMKARVEERGANVHLVRPVDEGVFYGAKQVDRLRCVHPIQAYLDLRGLPERAAEAAQHLRQHWINWS